MSTIFEPSEMRVMTVFTSCGVCCRAPCEEETRAVALQTQFNDLTSAKKSLEDIIFKINQDSQRLFMETFTVVRTHFQELFRKLFGGGMAEIILEDETDVLESGIDIIAKPPGKQLTSITLLSGGERSLVALAYLFAVFRSRPSPFYVMDEVEAALDDVNLHRFLELVAEFRSTAHLPILSHPKRTW